MTSTVSVGQKVTVKGESGIVRFVGSTQFAEGEWIGIELDTTIGKNNGEINGVRYFDLQKKTNNYGIFVKEQAIDSVPPGGTSEVRELGPKFVSANDKSPALFSTDPTAVRSPAASANERNNGNANSAQATRVDEVERLRKIILALQTKVQRMNDDIEALKLRLKNAKEENSLLKEKLEVSEEALEHKTIDSEMIEEKQVQLAEKLETLQKGYSLMTQQLGKYNRATEISLANGPSENVDSMMEKAVLMESVMTDLKEWTSEVESNTTTEISLLKAQVAYLQNFEKAAKDAEEKLAKSESLVKSLKEQIESSTLSDDLVESLTEKNLELTEKLDQLQVTIDELEQLQSLDEEVIKNHVELEAEIKDDIDSLSKKISEDKILIEELILTKTYLESKVAGLINAPIIETQVSTSETVKNTNEASGETSKLLAKLSLEKTSLAREVEFEKLEINELRSLIAQLETLIIDETLRNAKSVFKSVSNLKTASDKLAIVSQSVLEDAEEQSADIVYEIIGNCSRASCSLEFLTRMLKFNALRNTDSMELFLNSIDKTIEEITSATKDSNLENLKNSSAKIALETGLFITDDTKFATAFFKKVETLRLELAQNVGVLITPALWLVDILLNRLSSYQDERNQELHALLKAYFSILSQFRQALLSKIEELTQMSENSLELSDSIPIGFLECFKPVATLAAQAIKIDSFENDEVSRKLINMLPKETDDLKILSDKFKNLTWKTQKLARKTVVEELLENFSENSLHSTGTANTKNFESDLAHLSRALKAKENSLQEAVLRISLLNKKLADKNVDSSKVLAQNSKIKDLTDENLRLINDISKVEMEKEGYVKQLESLKDQGRSFVGSFDNIGEEKEFQEKFALIGEIQSLRNTLNKQLKASDPAVESWLFQNFSSEKPTNGFDIVKRAYRQLMAATNEFSIIPVSGSKGSQLVPKYYNTLMRNEYNKYERVRANLTKS